MLAQVSPSGVFTAFRGLTAGVDPGNVGAASVSLFTMNLPTLSPPDAAGDVVIGSPAAGDMGVAVAIFPGRATGAGSANLLLCNPTAGGLDPAAQTIDWSLFHASFRSPGSGIICFDKRLVTFDAGGCGADAVTTQAIAIPGTEPGDTVLIAAPAGFPANLCMGIGACLVAGTVQIPFVNPTGAPIDPGSLTYTVVILKQTQRNSPSGRQACIRGTAVAFNPPASGADAVTNWNVPIPGAAVGDVGAIATQLGTGLAYAVGRCDVAGTLIVPAVNVTAAPVDPAAADYNFVLFR